MGAREAHWRCDNGARRRRASQDIRRVYARRLTIGAAAPLLELGEAVLARPTWDAPGVVVGFLVERDLVAAVGVAEDVATLPAVVPARKVAEVPLAGGVVADSGFLVRLERQAS